MCNLAGSKPLTVVKVTWFRLAEILLKIAYSKDLSKLFSLMVFQTCMHGNLSLPWNIKRDCISMKSIIMTQFLEFVTLYFPAVTLYLTILALRLTVTLYLSVSTVFFSECRYFLFQTSAHNFLSYFGGIGFPYI